VSLKELAVRRMGPLRRSLVPDDKPDGEGRL